MNNRYLYFTVFASGMTTLAVEITASRLLGPAFGTSNLVWAAIIGLMLIFLAMGYSIGGRWSDRSPHPKTLYTILVWGAFTVGLVPLLAKPVLPRVAAAFDRLEVAILVGAFVGVLVLFVVPITLLGMISPFAIRLGITTPETAGAVAGKIYAISTIGSFIGTFLPVLVMIPLLGTVNTFLVFSLFLTVVSMVGLWLHEGKRGMLPYLWMPVVLILLAFLWGSNPFKTTTGQIYETESAYNYIEVLDVQGYTMLRLNEGQGVHSIYHPTQLAYYGPWMQFLAAPFFNPDFSSDQVERMAIVGLAAGTTARQATEVFGPIPLDGYEIDPEIIAVGREYFGMDIPNLNAYATDGRIGLVNSPHTYTIIGIDAYRPPYIPWHLTTREFFQTVYDHLDENGVMVINVGRAPDDRRLLNGLATTAGSIFPSIHVMDIPGTFNSIMYATRQPTTPDDMLVNLSAMLEDPTTHPLLLESVQRAYTYRREPPTSTRVFTDDLAPIEWITNNMVLQFLIGGGAETLQ